MTVTTQLMMTGLAFGIALFVLYFFIFKRNKLFGGLGLIGMGLGLTQITSIVTGADALIVVPMWILIISGVMTVIWSLLGDD